MYGLTNGCVNMRKAVFFKKGKNGEKVSRVLINDKWWLNFNRLFALMSLISSEIM